MQRTLRSVMDAADPDFVVFAPVGEAPPWSVRRIGQATDRVSARLLQQGLGGQAVALRLANCPEWMVLFLGLLGAGCRPLLVSHDAPEPDVDRLLDLAEGSWLVSGLGDDGEPILSARTMPGPHESHQAVPSVLIPTSGSTGLPTLISRSEASLIREAAHYRDFFAITPGELLTIPEPLSHAYALSWLACGLLAQATMRLVQPTALGAIEETLTGPGGIVCLTPTLTRLLVMRRRGTQSASARLVVIGAGPVDDSLAHSFATAFGTGLARVYGSTETGAICAGGSELPPRCVGPVLPGLQYRIVGDDGQLSPDGEPGCLELRTAPGLPWQATHDLVVADGAQRLTVLGRRSAAIRRNDRWIAPGEIEDALRRHPGVKDAVVTAYTHAGATRIVAAVEIVPDGPDSLALMAFLRMDLAPYKLPNDIRVALELPRTASGKLLAASAEQGLAR